jgi:histidinol-phosphatase (PHP family)
MYFDSHVHSEASPDSEMNPQDAVAKLKTQGLGIAFTEHVDFTEKNIDSDPHATDAIRGLGDFVCDFAKYPAQYEKFRGEGVSLGLEFGMTQAFLSANKKIAEGDYDFIIGAIHSVDGVELYNALNGLLPGENFSPCISRYLIYAREMVEAYDGVIDAFAHIDYFARYTREIADNFFYENYAQEFDALLKILAEREIALEINTNRFGDETAQKTMFELCRRYKELGGRICTIGSDAHKTEKLAYCFADAKKIAHEAQLAVVNFKNRKPIRCE